MYDTSAAELVATFDGGYKLGAYTGSRPETSRLCLVDAIVARPLDLQMPSVCSGLR
jgi:hypothetical protein